MKSFLVIGLGIFGQTIAKTLYHEGYDVLAVDKNHDLVQEISNSVTHAAVIDVLDEDAIKELGIANFDVVVVAIGTDMQASIMITLILKELGAKFIVAKSLNNLHGKLLLKIGANKVIYPEREMGERVAKSLISQNILDYIEISPEYSIMEVAAPEDWFGKTLKETNIRARYDITVIAVKKKDASNVNLLPGAGCTIKKDDVLILIGTEKNLNKFRNKTLE